MNINYPSIDDVRISEYKIVLAPEKLIQDLPVDNDTENKIRQYRTDVKNVLDGVDDRLLVVVGPCSIHDVNAATEYAKKLQKLSAELSNELLIVMRVYFEKPRTTVGWKGLINDPDLDESFNINKGLRVAREFLLQVNQLGLPTGTEFLDLISPQFVADLISWGAIGARTTESQGHRELTSGLSCPVGFKNGTSGSFSIAKDAIIASSNPHIFMSINKEGFCSIVKTKGNEDCHIILRGGSKPNYDAVSINKTAESLESSKLKPKIMVDFSHGNSLKQFQRQKVVAEDIASQISSGDNRIFGVMIESFLKEGNQSIDTPEKLTYGQSITDSCLGWDDTEDLLKNMLAKAVINKRNLQNK